MYETGVTVEELSINPTGFQCCAYFHHLRTQIWTKHMKPRATIRGAPGLHRDSSLSWSNPDLTEQADPQVRVLHVTGRAMSS